MSVRSTSRVDVYFITENEEDRENLLELNVREFTERDSRFSIKRFIEMNPSFCRPTHEENMFHYLIEGLMDRNMTTLFIYGGYKISGLLNFFVLKKDRSLVIHSICVPPGEPSGSGKILVNIAKDFAEKIKLKNVVTLSLPSAVGFYEKNGFVKPNSKNDELIYKIKEASHSYSRKTRCKKHCGKTIYTKSKKLFHR